MDCQSRDSRQHPTVPREPRALFTYKVDAREVDTVSTIWMEKTESRRLPLTACRMSEKTASMPAMPEDSGSAAFRSVKVSRF